MEVTLRREYVRKVFKRSISAQRNEPSGVPRKTAIDPSRISKIIRGKMRVSARMCILFEEAIPEVPARQWLTWAMEDELRAAR